MDVKDLYEQGTRRFEEIKSEVQCVHAGIECVRKEINNSNVILARNTESLILHVKRTDLLENLVRLSGDKVVELEKGIDRVDKRSDTLEKLLDKVEKRTYSLTMKFYVSLGVVGVINSVVLAILKLI